MVLADRDDLIDFHNLQFKCENHHLNLPCGNMRSNALTHRSLILVYKDDNIEGMSEVDLEMAMADWAVVDELRFTKMETFDSLQWKSHALVYAPIAASFFKRGDHF